MKPYVLLFCFILSSLYANKPNVLFIAIDDMRPAISDFDEKDVITGVPQAIASIIGIPKPSRFEGYKKRLLNE